MSDEYMGTPDTQAEPGQDQLQPPEGVAVEKTQPITKADLEIWSKEFRKDLLNVIRSQTTQSEGKIKKEVDAKLTQVETNFKHLKDAGYPVTEDDLKLARSQAINEAMRSLQGNDDEAKVDRTPALDPQQQAVISNTNKALRELQKRYDYALMGSDPEYLDLMDADAFNDPDPQNFLKQYEEKLIEINTRRGRPLPVAAQSVNPATRVPTPVGGGNFGSHEEQLNRRLQQIQATDPFSRDAALTKERTDIKRELEALYINRR